MLQTVWFVLWGLLWAIYFMLDGFDLGLGMLRPFVAGDEKESRIIYNVMGPFWDGNEVWLVTAGGVTFAAFPITYAVMFSTLYAPLLLILFGLIIRAVSFEFRGHIEGTAWKKLWDTCLFVGSFVPALLFGVAFANIFQGIPFDDKGVFHGTILTLVNPYGILGGVVFVILFLLHGCLWLAVKTDGSLYNKAAALSQKLWAVLLVVAVVFFVHTWFATTLYRNYLSRPLLFVIPIVTVAALLVTRLFIAKKAWWKAWFASAVIIASATLFGIVGLYPNMFPSTVNPAFSLTAFNSSSSPLTLTIMLVVVLIFVPIVILYQGWVYYLFKDKITAQHLESEEFY